MQWTLEYLMAIDTEMQKTPVHTTDERLAFLRKVLNFGYTEGLIVAHNIVASFAAIDNSEKDVILIATNVLSDAINQSEPKQFNACHEPCDNDNGPCVCGAWHKVDEDK